MTNMKMEDTSAEDHSNNKENQGVSASSDQGLKKQQPTSKQDLIKRPDIPADQMTILWSLPVVQNFILEADYALYQHLIEVLIPRVRLQFLITF
jgi:hypothetical protein